MSQPDILPQPAPVAAAMGAAAEQGRELLDASFRTWTAEARAYIDDLAKDGTEALKGLSRCQTPYDILVVEQAWILARSKAWLDATVRLLAGVVHEPESAAAELASFRLPE